MFPKVGDIVKLNPDFLKVWFKNNKYFGEEVWKEEFTVIEIIEISKDIFKIDFKYKDCEYRLYILFNGELSTFVFYEDFKGIQVFIPANFESNINNILIGSKIINVEIKNTNNGISLNRLTLDTKFGIVNIEMAWPSPQDNNIIAIFDSNENKIF